MDFNILLHQFYMSEKKNIIIDKCTTEHSASQNILKEKEKDAKLLKSYVSQSRRVSCL